MKINKPTILFLSFVLYVLLNGCSSSISDGGSVSDVGNPCISGLVVDSSGSPIEGAIIKIYPSDYNPVSDSTDLFPISGVSEASGSFLIPISDSVTQYTINVYGVRNSSKSIVSNIFGSIDTSSKRKIILNGFGHMKVIFKDSSNLEGSYLYISGSNNHMVITTSDILHDDERYVVVFDSLPIGTMDELVFWDGEKELGVAEDFIVDKSDTLDIHLNNIWSNFNNLNSSLPDDAITALFYNSKNQLWAGTAKSGIYILDNNIYTQLNGSEGLGVSAISEDNENVMWIGTNNGVYKYENSSFSNVVINELPNIEITDLHVDSRGVKWIGTSMGALKIDSSFVTIIDSSTTPLKESYITAISKDVDSSIVICTPLGFGINKNDTWTTYYSGDANCEIKDSIRDVTINQAGKTYFATKSGIVVLSGGFWYSYISEDEGIGNSNFKTISIDINNNVWAGTYSPSTIYDVGTSFAYKFDKYSVSHLNNSISVASIITVSDSVVYFGTEGNGIIKLSIVE